MVNQGTVLPVTPESDVKSRPHGHRVQPVDAGSQIDAEIRERRTLMAGQSVNPYVGPRPYTEKEWEYFFGRQYEAADLCSLVMANRLVLFYAPSGAGKSSLLNTSIRRRLQSEGFDVLPTARVSGDVQSDTDRIDNIFIFDLISDLDNGRQKAAELADLTLLAYLQRFDSAQPSDDLDGGRERRQQLLIIDQFEEIFTTHPEAWSQRDEFFRQLREAFDKIPTLWVILALREENVAALDRYKHQIPGGLRTRYYMQSLDHTAALEAIELPAQNAGRPFEPGVAKVLVKNLSLTWVRNHETRQYPGEFVEPLQLQVVCHQLWEDLRDIPGTTITQANLEHVAGTIDLAAFIDTALARFYDDGINTVVSVTDVLELDLRTWFEDRMITEAGTRNLVFCGEHTTGGLPNAAVKALKERLLLHMEERPAGTWVELIHDRLVAPIRSANLAWYKEHPLILLAREWDKAGRVPDKLLEGKRLQTELESDWRGLGKMVSEFLTASQEAEAARQQRVQTEQRQLELEHQRALARKEATAARKLRKLAVALAVTTALAIVGFGWAFSAKLKASAAEASAEQLSASLLAVQSTSVQVELPQLSLLLAAESAEKWPGADSQPVAVSKTITALHQALLNTPSTPLRGPDDQVIRDVGQLAMNPERDWLAAGSATGTVYLWRVADGDPDVAEYALAAHSDAITTLAYGAGGRWLASGGADGTVAIFDMQAPSQDPIRTAVQKEHGAITTLAFYPTDDPAASWLAIGSEAGLVQYIPRRTFTEAAPADLLGEQSRAAVALAFDPNGGWLATIDKEDTLRVWSLDADLPITDNRPLSKGKNGMIAVSPDGRWLATSKQGDSEVSLFDLGQQHGLPDHAIDHYPLKGHEQGVFALAFSPADTGDLAVGAGDGTIRLWNPKGVAATAEEVIPVEEKPGVVPPRPDLQDQTESSTAREQSDQANPPTDSKVPQLETTDGVSTLRHMSVQAEPKRLEPQDGIVFALDFALTPEKHSIANPGTEIVWLASSTSNRLVQTWNVSAPALPQLSVVASGHEVDVTSLRLDPKSETSFVLDDDGTVRLVAPDQLAVPADWHEFAANLAGWQNEACRRAGRIFTVEERAAYFDNDGYDAYCDSGDTTARR